MKTYGKIMFGMREGRKEWGVGDMPPHVETLFKRMFPRAFSTKYRYYLTDNDMVRADLLWFQQRFPMQVSHPGLIEVGAKRAAARVVTLGEIMKLEWKPGELSGFRPKKPPYNYQAQAGAVACQVRGLLLADDVGLGKTISTFAAAASGAPLPLLVVTQPHLRRQWAREAHEFTHYRVHTIERSEPYTLPQSDIVIISYTQLTGWIPVFKQGIFKSVAWDEVQELRHGEATGKGHAAAIIADKAEVRMGLSATPIFGHGIECHNIFRYIQPDLLGTKEEFITEWCKEGRQVRHPEALGSFLKDSGHMLRRLEDDPNVDKSLPKPNIIEFTVQYDEKEQAKHTDLLKALAERVLTGSFHQKGLAARELDSKMRQLTGIAKAKQVAAYVEMLLRERERVLLMGWHREVYDRWNFALRKYNPLLYTGSESAAGKERNLQRFIDGDCRVLMMSLRSGAGLNGLQKTCRDIVFGELDWSPPVHYQAIGRLRRPGQQHVVDAHFLHADGGSDPMMLQVLGIKKQQQEGIINPDGGGVIPTNEEGHIKRLAKHVLENL